MINSKSVDEINKWRSAPKEDELLIKGLKKKDANLTIFFEESMKFGTAGIVGKMGPGTSQMNEFTVAAAAKAYAQFLLKKFKNPSIVIGHDNRTNSELYTLITSKVMIEEGIKAYIFPDNDLQPAPLVSFAVRNMSLSGAVIITASHKSKEYNGFKVYDPTGAQLLPGDTSLISDYMNGIDLLTVKKSVRNPDHVPQTVIENYKKNVLNIQLNKSATSNVRVAFSAQNGAAAKMIPELLGSMDISVDYVKKQHVPDPIFKHTKTSNPEDIKAYRKVANLAFWKKADLIMTTDPEAGRLGVALRYKKTMMYMNGNEIASLYLDYRLSHLKQSGKLPKNGYIVTTYVSGALAQKIAAQYGVEVINVNVGFKNISNIIETKKDSVFLFGYEESYGFLIDPTISRDKDALQASVAIADMVKFHKSIGKCSYQIYQDLLKEHGTHLSSQISKTLTDKLKKKLFRKFSKISSINGDKVKDIHDYSSGSSKFLKIVFESGSWIALRPSGTEPKVKIYAEVISAKNTLKTEIVFIEKLKEKINEATEEFDDKKITSRGVFKYMFYASLIISIIVIVFLFIYSDSKTGKNGSTSAYTIAGAIVNSTNKWIWMTWWIWKVFTIFLNSWMKKRMFDMQNYPVKVRHLMVSSIMGVVIAFVTPFAVGGDAVGYWYLRRKGVKRAPLMATLITDTMLGETKFALQTILLVGIGWGLYKDIFNGTPEAQAALIWFFVGLSWSFFAAFMIMFITLNRRFQNASINTAVRFLSWIPYFHLSNPQKIGEKYKYELMLMRDSMKMLWRKWVFGLEMIFYTMLPLFFSPTALLYLFTGWNTDSIPTGGYMGHIIINDIVGTANSMSITPGGSGTKEWLGVHTSTILVDGSRQQIDHQFSAVSITSARDIMWKVLYEWPFLIVSAGTILSVIFVERRNISNKTKLKRKILSFVLLSALIVVYLLIYFLVLF